MVHHDIKPANILMDASLTVAKIGDLGASRILAGANATASVVSPSSGLLISPLENCSSAFGRETHRGWKAALSF